MRVNVSLTPFGNVGDVIILEIENPLSVLDHGASVRRDEELDRLGHAVLGQKGAGLGSAELGAGRSWALRGDGE